MADFNQAMCDEELRAEVTEMRAEVREMRQMMTQMEKRWDEKELQKEKHLVGVNSRIDGINSKLEVETDKINKQNSELKNEISLVVEENKSKILKLDVKAETLMNMLDKLDKKLQTEIENMKKQIENQDENIEKMNQSMKVLEMKLLENKAEMGQNMEKLKADVENFVQEETEKDLERFESKLNERELRVNEKMEDDVSRLNAKLTEVEEKVETLKTEFSKEFPQNKTMENLTTQMSEFNLVEHNIKFSPDFQWKITGLKEKLELGKFEVKSEVFQWANYNPIQSRAKLSVSGKQIWISLCLEEPEAEVALIGLIPKIYYVLRDQTTTGSEPKHMCRAREYPFTSKFGYSLTFETLMESALTEPPYNVDDSIAIDIFVEPPTMAREVHSYDGTLEWTIDHYRKRKEREREELVLYHESPYFYTGPKGYRVQVRLRLGLWLTAYVHFLPGEFDADLPVTFPHQTTVALVNRKDPRLNVTKTIKNYMANEKWYRIEMYSEREKESVVENDVLCCKVTIKAIEEKKKYFFF